jgi:hypothetical protein
MVNFDLLKAIKEHGLTQRQFAAAVGDHESVVSRIVNGVWIADTLRKAKYAKVLKRRPEDIFTQQRT